MHDNFVNLTKLSDSAMAIVELDKQIAAAERKAAGAIEAVVAAEAAQAAAEATLGKTRATERNLQRRIEDYRNRLAKAHKVLETGVGDPDAAERQRVQCAAILDADETSMLEVLETLDLHESELKSAQAHTQAMKTLQPTVQAECDATIADLKEQQGELRIPRDAAWSQLRPEVKKRYRLLWDKKKRPVVARVVDKACTSCRTVVHAQGLMDVRKGKLTACKCGRYLVIDE